jgi:hypothetical protein
MCVVKSVAYAAFETLVRAGLAAKRTARELGCPRAVGIQQVVMLTPSYLEQAQALGLPPVRGKGAMITSASPPSCIVEQAALGAELLRMLAAGWTVAHDGEAIHGLALARIPLWRGWGPAYYGADRQPLRSVLRPGQHATLLTPPGGATWERGAVPVLLLGGSWTSSAECAESLWAQLRNCAPLDLHAWPKSIAFQQRARKVLSQHCTVSRAPTAPELRWIGKQRGEPWTRHWNAVHATVRPDASCEARPTAWAGLGTLWEKMYALLRSSES